MPLTKQYLRYCPRGLFNLVGSGRGGGVFLGSNNQDIAAVAAAQDVVIWDLRKKERLRVLSGGEKFNFEVTCVSSNASGNLLAVGYTNGTIKLFDTSTGESEVTFAGHKNDVNCLSFDEDSMRLVSGSKDTSIIVWDIVAESGLYKLHGHKGPVTGVKFMKSERNIIVSSSKDTFIKFWDMTTQHCFKTMPGHVTEIWDFVLLEQDTILVTGGSDSELRIWNLEFNETEGKFSNVYKVLSTRKIIIWHQISVSFCIL
jgi:U3 small nucleolar RNA-associated protein 12